MLYWRSNTGTTACIDYTNGALDKACYIGGATLEQHVWIIDCIHVNGALERSMIIPEAFYWQSNTGTTAY